MLKAISKWRPIATWLLSAFILAASVDKLPDPPALKPCGSEANVFCIDHHAQGSFHPEQAWPLSASPAFFLVNWLDFAEVFEPGHLIRCASPRLQASDSSPPRPAS